MDVYPRFGPTSEWDTAAGQAIVDAAGGVVLDPRGRPLRYNQRDTVLNGDFMVLGDPALPCIEWLGDRPCCVLPPPSPVPLRPVRCKTPAVRLKRQPRASESTVSLNSNHSLPSYAGMTQ